MSILDLFRPDKRGQNGDSWLSRSETVQRIAAELALLPPERARIVASFAYLLGRVAHADLDISEGETAQMERSVSEMGRLPAEQAALVVSMAKQQNVLFGGTEDYLVTQEFRELANREQKLALLQCLFDVSAADGSISSLEENEIRQIASEIGLEHEDYTAVKAGFQDVLAVLKP